MTHLRTAWQASIATFFVAAAACATAQTRWTGGLLTDPAGVPLFVSEAEPPGVSQCYDACLNIWVPYKAPPNAKASGALSIVQRQDGSLQWAYKGKALYHWWNAKKPMDGQGMRGGNWHVVKAPEAAASAAR